MPICTAVPAVVQIDRRSVSDQRHVGEVPGSGQPAAPVAGAVAPSAPEFVSADGAGAGVIDAIGTQPA